jgi:hypothetical protein
VDASLLNSIMKAKEIRAAGIWDSKVNRMSLAMVYSVSSDSPNREGTAYSVSIDPSSP